MKIINYVKTSYENHKLKNEVSRLEMLVTATEKDLMYRVMEYRKLLGEREQLLEKLDLLDRSLTNANKTINEIVKVAQDNDYGNSRTKVKKILELATFGNTTSPSK